MMIRTTRRRFVRPRLVALLIVAFYASSRPAYAQLDPLLGLKAQKPNVLLLVDTSQSMQYDADGTYYDPRPYIKSNDPSAAGWQQAIGVTSSTTGQSYYRKYVNLKPPPLLPLGFKYQADRIDTVGDLQPGFATFFERSRIEIAKRAVLEMVDGSFHSARFNLLRLGQVAPAAEAEYESTNPVRSNITSQQSTTETPAGLLGLPPPAGWKITRTTNLITGNSLMSLVGPLLPADALGGNQLIRDTVADSLGTTGALVPIGLGDLNLVAPVSLLLQQVLTELVRLLTGAPVCQNTAIIMVVGGSSIVGLVLEVVLTLVSQLLGGLTGRRIPIHIVAIAPPEGIELNLLRSISDLSGGRFTEVTKSQIDLTVPGQPVPAAVNALNWAVQHALLPPAEFNNASTAAMLRNLTKEHQSTSPITGTVDLHNRSVNGNVLPNTRVYKDGKIVPQRSNVMVTSGYALPGFEGKLHAFRTYKPVADTAEPTGYRFSQDGTRLWVASTPAAASRNIFTVLPDGTMTAFTTQNATALKPYLGPVDAADLIQRIRSQPLGAVVGSTPAIMDPPSLEPQPENYGPFLESQAKRRSIIFVGANDGMMHAIDARTGLELWAFIPFNLLPKLRSLPWGHGVDAGFRYMVDSSPKLSDVKVNGEWRTYLFFGQGSGGTFYNAIDVTLDRMGDTVSPTEDSQTTLLSYFSSATRMQWMWSFPRLASFDPTIMPFGDVAASASAAEKTVGYSFSDPAVGRIGDVTPESGSFHQNPYAVYVGSGMFPYTRQQMTHRGGAVAGTTFYMLSASTGLVLASKDVGSDGIAETVDDCRTATQGCSQLKNALQMDPVATGSGTSSHGVSTIYVGDLDGRVWRMGVSFDTSGVPQLSSPVKLYDLGATHPLFASMAAVDLPSVTGMRLFIGTGSDLLPSKGVAVQYKLLMLDDSGGATATLKGTPTLLERTDNSGKDERVTGFPAVAGGIVFFSTTTTIVAECTTFETSLYALDPQNGGAAYDTNGDGKLSVGRKDADSTRLFTTTGTRGTAPFIVDQHLYVGVGNKVEVLGESHDYNNQPGPGQSSIRILSWRGVR